MDSCFLYFLAFVGIVLAIIALARGGTSKETLHTLQRLREDLEALRVRTNLLERRLRQQEEATKHAEPPPAEPKHAAPEPVASEPEIPVAAPPPVSIPEPPPLPMPDVSLPASVGSDSTIIEKQIVPPPVEVAAPVPDALPKVVEPTQILEPLRPAAPRPPAPRPVPRLPEPRPAPRRSWNLEDLLGTQVFLKVGVAIVVIGVVFAMGLVFKQMGPIGKLLMSYGGGLALLVAGLQAEKREHYRTFGRALIAGAWGILYFVTFAAGFMEAARVIQDRILAVLALILAASCCVGFSLRYRNEWTTTSAFLLIYLSLGIAAHEVEPGIHLSASLVVAVAMGLLIWRTGWLRLLGLGIPATWITLLMCVASDKVSVELWMLMVFAGCAVVFQLALLAAPSQGQRRAWQALGQIANFVGALGLCLPLAKGGAWMWALGFGLAHLAAAAAYRRKGEHGLYLLTATEGLAALALVSPLRLGLKNQLTPFMRLIGIELLLAAGVFLKERFFRVLAYGAFALTVLEILFIRLDAVGKPDVILLGCAGVLALLNATLMRLRWEEILDGELPGLAWAFSSTGVLLLSVALWLKLGAVWQGPVFAGLALGWAFLGSRRNLKDLGLQACLWAIQAVVALVLVSSGVAHPSLSPGLIPSMIFGVAGLGAAWAALKLGPGTLDEAWRKRLGAMMAFLATLGLATALIRLVPAHGAAPSLALAALLLWIPGLKTRHREWIPQALILDVLALVSLGILGWSTQGSVLHLPVRAATLLGLALAFLAQEWLVRRWQDAWEEAEESLERVVLALNTVLALILVLGIWLELPAVLQAPALMLLGLLWMFWARARTSAWLCLEAVASIGLGVLNAILVAWPLEGAWKGIPLRFLAILPTLVLAYFNQHLLFKSAVEEDPDQILLSDHMDRQALSLLATGLLWASGLAMGGWIKAEALAHGKNLLVALGWGAAGLVHLVRGRALKSAAWRLLGHGAMTAAFLHFVAVNLLQPGTLGGLSLRLITGLPFLAMLIFVHLDKDCPTEKEDLPLAGISVWAYLYGINLLVVLVALYEVHRAWVLPVWALHALLALIWGLRRDSAHWLRCALILMVACAVRGIGSNLVFRDLQGSFSLNLVTVPLAAGLILAGYILLRRKLEKASFNLEGLGAGLNRLPWFTVQAVLLFGFIWVEASGTELTVWLSLFGLGMVTLGFVFQERLARLTGLGLLSACILKLFIYDLRGLTGISRVLSFIVLGIVLISVSFVYTRFKERLEKLL